MSSPLEHAAAAVSAASALAADGSGATTHAGTSMAEVATPAAAASAAESAAAATEGSGEGGRPPMYLISYSVVKRHNVGMLMRSCVAFGVSEMLVCGGYRVQGDQGTERYMPVREFRKLREAAAYCKARGITICGIEITPDAVPVQEHPFRGPTAFLPGNEGAGLDPFAKSVCDHFVYIPQYGGGTASLNVGVATSIVMFHYGLWAGYTEQQRQAGKDKFLLRLPPARKGLADQDQFKREYRSERESEHKAGTVWSAGIGSIAAFQEGGDAWQDEAEAEAEAAAEAEAEGGEDGSTGEQDAEAETE